MKDIENNNLYPDEETPVLKHYSEFDSVFVGLLPFFKLDKEWVEWFIGGYSATIFWNKTEDDEYEIEATIRNTSSWYSGTRLPKTWQDKIKETIGLEIENLVDSAPRGETIKRKLPAIVIKTLEWMGMVVPSFGGNWSQEFKIKTLWKK